MSPDHVWEMCRVPSGSIRRRGDVLTSIIKLLFSHTYLEVICMVKYTRSHFNTLYLLFALCHFVQQNTISLFQMYCTESLRQFSPCHVLKKTHTEPPTNTNAPYPTTYACTQRELFWLIVSVQAFQLISSVLRLIKGAVWSYYSVYIFICLPRDLINAVGPQVTDTLITGLHRHDFTPSETDAWAHTLSCSSLSEEWGKVMG